MSDLEPEPVEWINRNGKTRWQPRLPDGRVESSTGRWGDPYLWFMATPRLYTFRWQAVRAAQREMNRAREDAWERAGSAPASMYGRGMVPPPRQCTTTTQACKCSVTKKGGKCR